MTNSRFGGYEQVVTILCKSKSNIFTSNPILPIFGTFQVAIFFCNYGETGS